MQKDRSGGYDLTEPGSTPQCFFSLSPVSRHATHPFIHHSRLTGDCNDTVINNMMREETGKEGPDKIKMVMSDSVFAT